MNTQEFINDCMFAVDDRDMLLADVDDLAIKVKTLDKMDDTIYSYPQSIDARTKSACTLFGPLAVVSSMFNIRMTQSQIIDVWNMAEKEYGYVAGVGNYFQKGVACVQKWWNKNYADKTVVYYRGEIGDQYMDILLDKGYGLVIGYRGNSEYGIDRQDGVLDGTTFSPPTYGHCTSLFKLNGKYTICDSTINYVRYTIPDIKKVKAFYKAYYVYIPNSMSKDEQYIRTIMAGNSSYYKQAQNMGIKRLLNNINNLCREFLGEQKI